MKTHRETKTFVLHDKPTTDALMALAWEHNLADWWPSISERLDTLNAGYSMGFNKYLYDVTFEREVVA